MQVLCVLCTTSKHPWTLRTKQEGGKYINASWEFSERNLTSSKMDIFIYILTKIYLYFPRHFKYDFISLCKKYLIQTMDQTQIPRCYFQWT